MKSKTKAIVITGAVVAATGASIGIASASAGGDDAEAPITGQSLERAKDAALEHTGEGRVTETEVGDEDSYYEVEVTLPSGEETDVQLNKDFTVVSSEADDKNDDKNDD